MATGNPTMGKRWWYNSQRTNRSMTRATRLIAGLILVGGLLGAEDFQLYFLGLWPISLHTTLTYEGKGEHLVATARNEMDEPIEHVKICVSATPKSCLFELWNTEVWKSGADLEWNVDATKKAPTLAHAASVMSISLPRDKAEMAKSPDSIFTWEIGKVIDTNRARYLASIWQSSSTSGSSSTSSSASLNASTLTTGPLSQTSGTVNGQSSGDLELSPKLRQTVKSQNSANGELTHGIVSTEVHEGSETGCDPAAGDGVVGC
jgi:hypothetical protein